MIANTPINNLSTSELEKYFFSEDFLYKSCLPNESITNDKTQVELNIIYLENLVVMQLRDKNAGVTSYCANFKHSVAQRIKKAWQWEAAAELIALAGISENALMVMSCDFKTWEIPFSSIPCLNRIPQTEKQNFEIDEDGSYIYWKYGDTHLDLEDFKAAVDPEFKAKLLIDKLEYHQSFGRAIAAVRKEHKLTQDSIKGISARHLRRIENEGYQPTVDTFKKLAQAHNLSFEDYLSEVNKFYKRHHI